MDEKINSYYKNNFLYAGHRMVLPETNEKLRNSCEKCVYYIDVVGQQKTRKVCVSGVKAYRSGTKRVPDSIEILDLILLLGKESLEKMLGMAGNHKMSCGVFESSRV